MGFSGAGGSLVVQATTGVAGFALQNGTPTILTWTAPNDGKAHVFIIAIEKHTTSTETGGNVSISCTFPDGGAFNNILFSGGAGAGTYISGSAVPMVVQAGSVVTVSQSSALTAGATTIFCTLIGS